MKTKTFAHAPGQRTRPAIKIAAAKLNSAKSMLQATAGPPTSPQRE